MSIGILSCHIAKMCFRLTQRHKVVIIFTMSIEDGSHQSNPDLNSSFQPPGSYEESIGFMADIGEAKLNLSGESFALLMRAYWANAVEYCKMNGMTFEAGLFSEGVTHAEEELQREREGELPGISQ